MGINSKGSKPKASPRPSSSMGSTKSKGKFDNNELTIAEVYASKENKPINSGQLMGGWWKRRQ